MCHSGFPTERFSKVAFFLSQLKNNHKIKPWGKTRMKHNRSNTYELDAISQKKFRLIRPVHVISKQINRNISCVQHRKFSFFSVTCILTSSMNGFCKNWKWLVFLLLKSQSTWCESRWKL